MSLASQSTQQKMPYPVGVVYEKLLEAIHRVGMSIKQKDEMLKRVSVSTGMSMFSWGENVSIVVNDIDDKTSVVSIDSSLKLGVNLAGAHKHQKNFDKIIYSLSDILKEWERNNTTSYAAEKSDEEYLEEARKKAGLI